MSRIKNNTDKKWYQKKKVWIWIGLIALIIFGINSLGSSEETNSESKDKTAQVANKKIKKEKPTSKETPAKEVPSKKTTPDNEDKTAETPQPAKTETPREATPATHSVPDVPTEYKSALRKAESYAGFMHMSKQGVLEQLTSEYGEKFSQPAAQYAVDNVKADWNKNALEKAKSYQKDMSMSPEGIREQLTSEYGEHFTPEEANYAVNNLN